MKLNTWRRLWVAAIAMVLLVSACWVGTSEVLAAPPGDKGPPVVTVNRKGKTALKGELLEARPADIKIKTKGMGGGADGEEIVVPWSEIVSVSNGLTRAKSLEAFTKDHGDQLCPTCRGKTNVRCETCKGTRHPPAAAKDCATCKGEMLVDCTTPKCTKGMVKCPNTCLKLGEGTWTEKEGKHVRIWVTPKGSSWISDGHLGELIKKDGDNYVPAGKCPTCDGKMVVPDPACDGTSKRTCPECLKRAGEACKECTDGRTECKTCAGSGMKATK